MALDNGNMGLPMDIGQQRRIQDLSNDCHNRHEAFQCEHTKTTIWTWPGYPLYFSCSFAHCAYWPHSESATLLRIFCGPATTFEVLCYIYIPRGADVIPVLRRKARRKLAPVKAIKRPQGSRKEKYIEAQRCGLPISATAVRIQRRGTGPSPNYGVILHSVDRMYRKYWKNHILRGRT